MQDELRGGISQSLNHADCECQVSCETAQEESGAQARGSYAAESLPTRSVEQRDHRSSGRQSKVQLTGNSTGV